jgi:hypothetical protein
VVAVVAVVLVLEIQQLALVVLAAVELTQPHPMEVLEHLDKVMLGVVMEVAAVVVLAVAVVLVQ